MTNHRLSGRALGGALLLASGLALAAPAGLDASISAGASSGRSRQDAAQALAELARRALEVNPTLDAARAAVAEADAGLRAARAPRLPALSAHASAIRFQEPMVASPIHGFDPASAPSFDPTLIQAGIGLSWTVFDGGLGAARVDGATARIAAEEESVADIRSALVQRVVEVFSEGASATASLRAQLRYVEALEAERERAAQRLAAGAEPRLTLLRAEAALERAVAWQRSAEGRLELALATLARLLDMPLDSLAGLDFEEMPEVPAPAGAAEAAPPAVLSAESRARAAAAEASAARATRLPTIDVTGGYNLFAGGETDPVAEWQAGVRISWPVFTGGAAAAAAQAASARSDAAQSTVRAARDRAGQAEDEARIAAADAAATLSALLAARSAFEELVRVERLGVDEGAGVQADLLRAEAELTEVDVSIVEARRSILLAHVRWARAVGALTPEWLGGS